MARIQIGGREVGKGCEPFVVAEAGINHNGDLETAYAMIAEAKRAGADAVKFQTFKADEFITDSTLTFTYKSQGKEVTESMLEMFRRCEFTVENWRRIRERCDRVGITFLSTPQNPGDLDLLLDLGVTAIKIGSDDFTNLPLLRDYARSGLPILISCGMADLSEVSQALEALGTLDGYPTVLLLCTSQYPTKAADVHMLKLRTLGSAFPGVPLGFSDHTQGCLAASMAVALGACVFEKHFTMDHGLAGPDHWFSEDPKGLSEWIAAIRTADAMLGSPVVRPTAAELTMRTLARRSIVALRNISEGETLDPSSIGLRRPGGGLSPGLFEVVVGRSASKALRQGQQVGFGDFK